MVSRMSGGPGRTRGVVVLVGMVIGWGAASIFAEPSAAGAVPTPAAIGDDRAARQALDGTSRAELPGFSSVAVNDDGTALFANPAAIDRSVPAGWLFLFEDAETGGSDRWTLGLTGGPLGLGYQSIRARAGENISRWTFALGGGGRTPFSFGVRGAREHQQRLGPDETTWRWDAGVLWRPNDAISLGATGEDLNQGRIFGRLYDRAYTLGAAVRPLPYDRRSRLTLFGEISGDEVHAWSDAAVLNTGLSVEPIPGVELSGSVEGPLSSFSEDPVYRVAIGFSGLRVTTWAGARYDESAGDTDRDRTRTVYGAHGTAARQRTLQREPVLARLTLAGTYGDEGQSGLPLPIPMLGSPSWQGIRPVLVQLERAAEDPDVKGLLLHLGPLSAGALTSEVRAAIGRVRAAGKPVVAYMDDCEGLGQYHIASACDRIVVDPLGGVSRLGFRADLLYFGEMLDSAGITVEKIAHGRFKTAGENLVLREASEGQKEAINAILDDAREVYLADFSSGRNLARERVEELCDGRLMLAAEAVSAGLVDTLADHEAAEKLLARLARRKEGTKPVSLAGWTYRNYAWSDGPRIAVVWLDGAITTGKSRGGFLSENSMGSETVVAKLRSLKQRDEVKAVVLRVDSPGGSALASDQIWRAVEEVQKAGKKVVVSMSRVAGSGGYYIACGADEIFADPMTITGSIGVLGLKPHFAGFYRKHGIGVSTFERGRMMGMYSGAVPLTEEQTLHMQKAIDDTYETFLARVAAGRPLTRDEIDAVGQGRIWTGRQALERKLIDGVGGLHEALARARELASLPEDVKVEHLSRPRWGVFQAARDGINSTVLSCGSALRLCPPPVSAIESGFVPVTKADPTTLAEFLPLAVAVSEVASPLEAWAFRLSWARRAGVHDARGPVILLRHPLLDAVVAAE